MLCNRASKVLLVRWMTTSSVSFTICPCVICLFIIYQGLLCPPLSGEDPVSSSCHSDRIIFFYSNILYQTADICLHLRVGVQMSPPNCKHDSTRSHHRTSHLLYLLPRAITVPFRGMGQTSSAFFQSGERNWGLFWLGFPVFDGVRWGEGSARMSRLESMSALCFLIKRDSPATRLRNHIFSLHIHISAYRGGDTEFWWDNRVVWLIIAFVWG